MMQNQPSRYDWEDQHSAFLAGIEYAQRERMEELAEQRAHEILHERSLEMLGMARRYASAKGPYWTAMVCGEDD